MEPNTDIMPVESPGTEAGTLVSDMADEQFMTLMEKAAENAPRIQAAMKKVLVATTYPGDWTDHDGTACLCSAGAERYLKLFPITFVEWQMHREDCSDKNGKAYRWVYECTAIMNGRQVNSLGAYSTRDKFLSYAHEKWKPIEEINENDIRAAARHVCIGNGIKTLLGLRGIETDHLKSIFVELGADPNLIKSIGYGKGKGSGSGAKSKPPAGKGKPNGNGKPHKTDEEMRTEGQAMLEEMFAGEPESTAQCVEECSSFEGSDGNTRFKTNLKDLKDKWLFNTVQKIKEVHKKYADAQIPY